MQECTWPCDLLCENEVKKTSRTKQAPTAKDLSQIALVLFTEIVLINAVLHGRRGGGGLCVCVSVSGGDGGGGAFLPQVCVLTAI